MGFSLSPSVVVREFDNSGIIPAVSTTAAAFSGQFKWGPCEELYLVEDEVELVNVFGKPTSTNFEDWFSAANFLLYSDTLWNNRVCNRTDVNLQNRARNSTVSNANGFLVMNDAIYNAQYNDGSLKTTYGCGEWIAKFPGDLGNTIKISSCQSASGYQRTLSGTMTVAAANTAVLGVSTFFQTEATVGDYLVINSETVQIAAITDNTHIVLRSVHVGGAAANTAIAKWEYFNEVDVAPGTSAAASAVGGVNDEIHIVVVDEDGLFTGQMGTVLESFPACSKAAGVKLDDGNVNYYVDKINQRSKYIRWAGHEASLTNAGNSAPGITFTGNTLPKTVSLQGGNDGIAVGTVDKTRGYDMFKNAELVDISLIIGGNASSTLATYLIQSIAEVRKDCVVFLSPRRSDVVNNVGNEATSSVNYRSVNLPSSSYGFMDNNWKYTYDKYNDVYRWVPSNADTAGLVANTDLVRDPWWSPAGFNRGFVKNATRMAWQASKTDRDYLYKNGINPVNSFPDLGTVLYGDKTLSTKPSAFDRINVRRLFIVLEKAIATAARFFLFELNDDFTRLQFRNMVEPFLRDVKGRRGLSDFRVICDTTNNTPEVIDRNEFVATIRIKPARSINFIYLNFVADRTDANFSESIGTF